MALGPRAVVNARPAAPPRVGLLPSVGTTDELEARWEAGFAYAAENCVAAGVFDPCGPGTLDPPANRAMVEADPFAVWAADECSAFGFSERDWQGRARRLLEACQSKQVERELWRGDLSRADSDINNAFLASADADVIGAPGTSLRDGLACLEQALADCSCGARGMIHATRQVVTHWQGLGLLRREGSLVLTINDTIVIPGAGYDGSGPPAAAGDPPVAAVTGGVWAYATGIVDVRLSPQIDIVPGSFAQAFDRSTNTIAFRAERLAAASWDGCCHIAIALDAALCG